MEKDTINNYIKAGKILQETQKLAKKSIKPGLKMIDIAEKIEAEIITLGGRPAFPINLSIGNIAAHYTPSANDPTELPEGAVLKVDIGVHIDGYIADAAFTMDFSDENGKMVEASEKALENALAILKPGITLGEIGTIVQETISKYGFNVIQNLSGHGLDQYDAHAAPGIPNIACKDSRKITDDMVFAIEPFATDGRGFVREGVQTEIFQVAKPTLLRNLDARKIMEFIQENYDELPFAERWIEKELKLGDFKRKVALRELMIKKCISTFPVLKEENDKIVTQAETTIMMIDGEAKILV